MDNYPYQYAIVLQLDEVKLSAHLNVYLIPSEVVFLQISGP